MKAYFFIVSHDKMDVTDKLVKRHWVDCIFSDDETLANIEIEKQYRNFKNVEINLKRELSSNDLALLMIHGVI